jgi:integrase
MRHPEQMGDVEIREFLSFLAVQRNVAASTQNQALAALLFLYREVLGRTLGGIEPGIRARRPARLPVVLTRDEVRRVLGCHVRDVFFGGKTTLRRGIKAD